MDPDPATEKTAEIVFDESRRLLERQESELDGLRSRATTLLGAAGLINGLFGVQSVRGQHYTDPRLVLLVAALSAFGAMTVCVIWIQWPTKFTFQEDVNQWLDQLEAGTSPRPFDFNYHFARQFTDFRATNELKMVWRYRGFTVACALLGVEVVCWGLSRLF